MAATREANDLFGVKLESESLFKSRHVLEWEFGVPPRPGYGGRNFLPELVISLKLESSFRYELPLGKIDGFLEEFRHSYFK